ncbi:MAG: MATE family efflux transporter [Phycisphaerales bacterium]|nr:MATE family efflux transporter [Phycisphaerales bacterium]
MSKRKTTEEIEQQRIASMQPSPEDLQEPLSELPGSIQSGSLAGKSMPSAIFFLAMPILVQQILVACVGLADKMFAGALPEEVVLPAMDAIGIGSYIGWFIAIAVSGVGVGGQALIARAMGGGKKTVASEVLGQSIVLAGLWGIVVGAGLWFAATPLGVLANLSDEASTYLVQYIHILALSMPLCSIMTTGSMALHGSGDTLRPAIVTLFVNIVNITVSFVMSGADVRFSEHVFENPFAWDLHVVGIALGTAAAYVVGGLCIVGVLIRGVKDLKLEPKHLIPRVDIFGKIAKIGVPSFFEGLSMWAANLFALYFIGQISVDLAKGTAEKAVQGLQGAHVIAVQWEAFSFLPGFAIGTAAGALAGQYLGANNPNDAKKATVICVCLAALFMGVMGIGMIVGGEQLTLFISKEPLHLQLVPKLLFIAGITQVGFAVMMVIRQALKGVGDTVWTFMITTFSSWFIRLPAAWFLGVHLEYGLVGIWYALCGEIVIRAILFSIRFLQGGWIHRKIT